jgi:hypothetical protein
VGEQTGSGLYIRRYLVSGVLTVVPLWITWVVFDFILGQLSTVGRPWVTGISNNPRAQHPVLAELLLDPRLHNGLAVLLTLVGLYLLGKTFLAPERYRANRKSTGWKRRPAAVCHALWGPKPSPSPPSRDRREAKPPWPGARKSTKKRGREPQAGGALPIRGVFKVRSRARASIRLLYRPGTSTPPSLRPRVAGNELLSLGHPRPPASSARS